MAGTVYFDTSVFLDILGGKPNGPEIRDLLRELKASGVRVCTSIVTAQEVSVLSYRRKSVSRDMHRKVARFARYRGVDIEVALTAAKLEAFHADDGHENEDLRRQKQRRKWDCFHLATAMVNNCSAFYTTDSELLNFAQRNAPHGMKAQLPKPSQGALALGSP